MLEFYLKVRNWLAREEGQDLIEYALLVGLISIVAVVSITSTGSAVSVLFANVASAVTGAQ